VTGDHSLTSKTRTTLTGIVALMASLTLPDFASEPRPLGSALIARGGWRERVALLFKVFDQERQKFGHALSRRCPLALTQEVFERGRAAFVLLFGVDYLRQNVREQLRILLLVFDSKIHFFQYSFANCDVLLQPFVGRCIFRIMNACECSTFYGTRTI
jgi:hypothetical protein